MKTSRSTCWLGRNLDSTTLRGRNKQGEIHSSNRAKELFSSSSNDLNNNENFCLSLSLLTHTQTEHQRAAAEAVLKAVQSHPDAWSRVDAVLEHSRNAQSKFFALQILEDVIKRRWGALPDEQRAGVRNFVSNMIIACASAEAPSKSSSRASKDERTFLHKLDVALVQILKQDWPHAWPSFVPDLCAASRASAPLCENSMVILKLLSEEVFDFSRGELTQAKTRELKSSLNTQFGAIHELCMFALAAGAGPLVAGDGSSPDAAPVSASLVRATLDTLHAYLSWVSVFVWFLFLRFLGEEERRKRKTTRGKKTEKKTHSPFFFSFFRPILSSNPPNLKTSSRSRSATSSSPTSSPPSSASSPSLPSGTRA